MKTIYGVLTATIIALFAIFYYYFLPIMNTTTQPTTTILDPTHFKNAYFAGGCFWCMEGIFESQSGVSEAISGYAGGTREDATYALVSSGRTKHRESVEVIYNPAIITYATLVDLFFTQIDPTQPDGQFADRGYHYTTAILYSTPEERIIAETAIKKLNDSKKFDKKIAVIVEPKTTFFAAEEDHQDYYKKSTFRYNQYKEGSGRQAFIDENWTHEIDKIEEPKSDKIREKLTNIQYKVTQEEATEAPYDNPYWDNHVPGIYVDVVDGSPLFASFDKFDSGTGWPSFTRVMTGAQVTEKTDTQLFSTRTEVRSTNANSHLGHLFQDGPLDTGGMRYCINSAALRFIQVADLEREGYPEYIQYFNKK